MPRQYFENASIAPIVNATPVVAVPQPCNGPPRLSESYLPAVMQALAYYVELIQYEPLYTTTIEPPFTLPAADSTPPSSGFQVIQTTTTRLSWTPSTTTSTARPTTTSPWWVAEQTTPYHKPGYYSPEQPPRDTTIEQGGAPKPAASNPNKSPRPIRPAQTGDLPLLSISNQPYFDYYLHGRKTLTKKIGN